MVLNFPWERRLLGMEGRECVGSDIWRRGKSSQGRGMGRTISEKLEAWEIMAPSGPGRWLILTRTCIACS